MNLVLLIGRLGKDPEVRSTAGGKKVVNFTLATDSFHGGQKRPEWHSAVAFDKAADIISQYAKKGSRVAIQGRIETRSWDDKASGEKKYKTEIICDKVEFTGSAPKDEFNQETSYREPQTQVDDDDMLPF